MTKMMFLLALFLGLTGAEDFVPDYDSITCLEHGVAYVTSSPLADNTKDRGNYQICQDDCMDNYDCSHWTFYTPALGESKGRCELFTAVRGFLQLSNTSDISSSGPKICTDCFSEDIEYTKEEPLSVVLDLHSVLLCQDQCQGVETCTFFVYFENGTRTDFQNGTAWCGLYDEEYPDITSDLNSWQTFLSRNTEFKGPESGWWIGPKTCSNSSTGIGGPTESPTIAPSQSPTESPTAAPSQSPTESPTTSPTKAPSLLTCHDVERPTLCQELASKGSCQNSGQREWLWENCALTCGTCDNATVAPTWAPTAEGGTTSARVKIALGLGLTEWLSIGFWSLIVLILVACWAYFGHLGSDYERFGYTNFLAFPLGFYDFWTDLLFLFFIRTQDLTLFYLSLASILICITINTATVLWLFKTESTFKVTEEFCSNLSKDPVELARLQTVADNTWFADYLRDNLSIVMLTIVLSGFQPAALRWLWSHFLHDWRFSAPMRLSSEIQLMGKYSLPSLFLENIPQLAIQLAYAASGNADPIVYVTMSGTALQILFTLLRVATILCVIKDADLLKDERIRFVEFALKLDRRQQKVAFAVAEMVERRRVDSLKKTESFMSTRQSGLSLMHKGSSNLLFPGLDASESLIRLKDSTRRLKLNASEREFQEWKRTNGSAKTLPVAEGPESPEGSCAWPRKEQPRRLPERNIVSGEPDPPGEPIGEQKITLPNMNVSSGVRLGGDDERAPGLGDIPEDRRITSRENVNSDDDGEGKIL